MLRRLRHALIAAAIALGFVGLAAAPAQAVCSSAPNFCTRIVHSVYSDVSNLSVTETNPVKAGYIKALARGTAGVFAGYYVPVCYQARETSNYGTFYRVGAGWRYLGVLSGSTVVELQRLC